MQRRHSNAKPDCEEKRDPDKRSLIIRKKENELDPDTQLEKRSFAAFAYGAQKFYRSRHSTLIVRCLDHCTCAGTCLTFLLQTNSHGFCSDCSRLCAVRRNAETRKDQPLHPKVGVVLSGLSPLQLIRDDQPGKLSRDWSVSWAWKSTKYWTYPVECRYVNVGINHVKSRRSGRVGRG